MTLEKRILWLDPFSGMAGDMFLAALLDLGLSLDALRARLSSLPVEGFRLAPRGVLRGAIRATKLDVVVRDEAGQERVEGDGGDPLVEGHGHSHDGGHRHGRSAREIFDLIGRWEVEPSTRDRAGRIFLGLAEAEGRVHGVAPDDVHFHEVGALDSIVDICGAAAALDILQVGPVYSAPIGLGGGLRRMAHGLVPMPAPATLEIVKGMPTYRTGVDGELLTPTGAAILREIVTDFQVPPGVTRFLAVGYGAGTTERADPPNVLRASLLESVHDSSATPTTIVELSCQVDDMTGEDLGFLRESLEALGCLDLTFEAIQMKKDRPGIRVEVLCEPAREEPMVEALLRQSSTFGLRRRLCERVVLDREVREIPTPLGPAQLKIGRRDGRILKYAAEYEDCRRLARESGRPVAEVRRIIESAFDPGSVPGSS